LMLTPRLVLQLDFIFLAGRGLCVGNDLVLRRVGVGVASQTSPARDQRRELSSVRYESSGVGLPVR